MGAECEHHDRLESKIDRQDGKLDQLNDKLTRLQLSVAKLIERDLFRDKCDTQRDKEIDQHIKDGRIWHRTIVVMVFGLVASVMSGVFFYGKHCRSLEIMDDRVVKVEEVAERGLEHIYKDEQRWNVFDITKQIKKAEGV